MLPDGNYDAFVIDADPEGDASITRVELTITSGEHKGDVVAVRAAGLERDAIDLIGLPVNLVVTDGTPTVTFDD